MFSPFSLLLFDFSVLLRSALHLAMAIGYMNFRIAFFSYVLVFSSLFFGESPVRALPGNNSIDRQRYLGVHSSSNATAAAVCNPEGPRNQTGSVTLTSTFICA